MTLNGGEIESDYRRGLEVGPCPGRQEEFK
jgi:hypothetical protein